MMILSIETSCDETAVSIVRAEGDFPHATYEVLAHALFSQMDIHKEYGGVFPAVAKREHAKTLVPMLKKALEQAEKTSAKSIFGSNPYRVCPLIGSLFRLRLTKPSMSLAKAVAFSPHGHSPSQKLFCGGLSEEKTAAIEKILEREPGLAEAFLSYFRDAGERPAVDLIAVTNGPGLEPALWVGVNFAKALALAWNVPIVPVNHMEGHIFISLFGNGKLAEARFPILALLISGGHTELVLMRDWNEYELVGQTRDDAVGEAFDKVARMLGLPYPGGPQISKLAEHAREEKLVPSVTLPRPMIAADNYDFSFSGLKTAVLYAIRKHYKSEYVQNLSDTRHGESGEGSVCGDTMTETQGPRNKADEDFGRALALEFENAAAEVLVAKTKRALDAHNAQTLVLGGGVSANTHIRRAFTELFAREYPERTLYLPEPRLTTDNALMIALAAHARAARGGAGSDPATIVADGNLSLHTQS
ncbi:tRNA (adenosine(37)-N6)-threonylcarbamoyltransferase complex transferase subunit TsaD [Candidatus Kaiserbacteria bacterium]|nr:tRNA (adenosine(37)-N6)-threonylcarbamoyltransferase complex transferase subunit TsaD [Candidatus Kaiserbacteria bacterium]